MKILVQPCLIYLKFWSICPSEKRSKVIYFVEGCSPEFIASIKSTPKTFTQSVISAYMLLLRIEIIINTLLFTHRKETFEGMNVL